MVTKGALMVTGMKPESLTMLVIKSCWNCVVYALPVSTHEISVRHFIVALRNISAEKNWENSG